MKKLLDCCFASRPENQNEGCFSGIGIDQSQSQKAHENFKEKEEALEILNRNQLCNAGIVPEKKQSRNEENSTNSKNKNLFNGENLSNLSIGVNRANESSDQESNGKLEENKEFTPFKFGRGSMRKIESQKKAGKRTSLERIVSEEANNVEESNQSVKSQKGSEESSMSPKELDKQSLVNKHFSDNRHLLFKSESIRNGARDTKMRSYYVSMKHKEAVDRGHLKMVKKTMERMEEKEYCLNQQPFSTTLGVPINVIVRKPIKSERKIKFGPLN